MDTKERRFITAAEELYSAVAQGSRMAWPPHLVKAMDEFAAASNDNGPITAADLAKALRHMGVNEDKWDWLAQEAAIMLEDQAAEITDLRNGKPQAGNGAVTPAKHIMSTNLLAIAQREESLGHAELAKIIEVAAHELERLYEREHSYIHKP
jgi:hypothetical protein